MGKLKKEGLITSILKSEISNAERDYMKHFNTNVDKKTLIIMLMMIMMVK